MESDPDLPAEMPDLLMKAMLGILQENPSPATPATPTINENTQNDYPKVDKDLWDTEQDTDKGLLHDLDSLTSPVSLTQVNKNCDISEYTDCGTASSNSIRNFGGEQAEQMGQFEIILKVDENFNILQYINWDGDPPNNSISLSFSEDVMQAQKDTSATTAPPTIIEDILNDSTEVVEDLLDLPNTKQDTHQDLLELNTSVSTVSPISSVTRADDNWIILEYTDCGTASSNSIWNFDGEETEQMAQLKIDEISNGDPPNRNVSTTGLEIISELENLKTLGYTDCDVYESSDGILQNTGTDIFQEQLSNPQQKSVIVCSRADDSSKRRYKCDMCSKSYHTQSVLNMHKVGHGDPQKLQCKVCQKSFTLPLSLNDHMSVHTDEKPYECKVCKRSFRLKRFLRKHTKVVTCKPKVLDARPRPFQCNVCKKTYLLKSHLRGHEKIKGH